MAVPARFVRAMAMYWRMSCTHWNQPGLLRNCQRERADQNEYYQYR
jgi:hypothetical protein